MTISSSLNAGVAGLNVNASRLATIADNIANSGTYGYKRSVADFHSMVISSGRGTYSAGGVRVTTQKLIDQPGALVTTNNSTDLAVRGRGFLPVTTGAAVDAGTGEWPLFMTTTGSFRTDSEGYLRDSTGVTLLGWPANADGTIPNFPRDTGAGLEPVQVNVNQFTSEPTTRMSLGVNLPGTDTLAATPWVGDARQLSVEYFDNLGTSQSIDISFTPVDPGGTASASNTWVMEMSDTATADADNPIGWYMVVFNDDRTNGGTIADVYQVPADYTGPPAEDPFALAAAMTPALTPPAATPTGGAWDPSTGELTVSVGGDSSNNIDVNIGARNMSGAGLTQLSDNFAPTAISKDGSPVGNLTSVEVDANGFVRANFDVGITRTVYQIPLIDLPNPNGLMAHDNQLYTPTDESGSFFLWDAADGPTGDIVGFALEESSTDVAGELTQLIQTQRAYSSNAKIITTVDEMLQETTNMKR